MTLYSFCSRVCNMRVLFNTRVVNRNFIISSICKSHDRTLDRSWGSTPQQTPWFAKQESSTDHGPQWARRGCKDCRSSRLIVHQCELTEGPRVIVWTEPLTTDIDIIGTTASTDSHFTRHATPADKIPLADKEDRHQE